MLRTDAEFDDTKRFVKDPDDPDSPWIRLMPPDVPRRNKKTQRKLLERDPPVYTRYRNGTITVRQSFLDKEFPTSAQECDACRDRIEKDEFGNVLYQDGNPQPVRRRAGLSAPQGAAARDHRNRQRAGNQCRPVFLRVLVHCPSHWLRRTSSQDHRPRSGICGHHCYGHCLLPPTCARHRLRPA